MLVHEMLTFISVCMLVCMSDDTLDGLLYDLSHDQDELFSIFGAKERNFQVKVFFFFLSG